jgi:flagellar basal-body rod protein FlgB
VDNSYINTNKTIDCLDVALKGLNLKTQAITGNIANVNTKGYQRREADFEQALQSVLNKKDTDSSLEITDSQHFKVGFETVDDVKKNLEIGVDESQSPESGVDIDREMMDLTQTGLKYKALSNMAKKQFEGLKTIIRGG